MIFQSGDILFFNIGIDIFALILLSIIYSSGHKKSHNDLDSRHFDYIIRMSIVATILDIMTWFACRYPSDKLIAYAYLINCLLFFFQNLVMFCWLNYSICIILHRSLTQKELKRYILIPLAVSSIAIFSAPFTGFIFRIDSSGNYFRTSTANILFIAELIITIVPSFIAMRQRRKETLISRRNELITLASFPLLVLPGIIGQIVIHGIALVFPLASLSFLNIYLHRQNDMVTRDALTGLNNRGQLDRYLYSLFNSGGAYKSMAYVIADLNDFKRINDCYGHDQGDRALIDTAEILKKCFFGESAFIARYGGDEFIVILRTGSQEEVEKTIRKIKKRFKEFNDLHIRPFVISISIGYALYGEADCFTINKIMEKADRRMYEEKRRLKSGRDDDQQR